MLMQVPNQAAQAAANINWDQVATHLGWFDMLAIVVMLVGLFLGLKMGLATVLKWIVAVILAFIATGFTEHVAMTIHANVPIPITGLRILSFFFIAVITIVVCHFLFVALSILGAIQFKSILNRLGGFLFGGVLGVLFLSLFSSFLILFPNSYIQAAFTQDSVSGPYLLELNPRIYHTVSTWIAGEKEKLATS